MATKLDKIAKVMQKAEEFAMKEINGNSDDQLLVAAGISCCNQKFVYKRFGSGGGTKVFEVMLESFIVADEIIDGVYTHQKPTIH